MILSPVFATWLVNETGLKLAGSEVDPPLWIGEIRPSFRISGISPESNEDLRILFSIKATLVPPFLRRHGGTPSGPGEEPFGIFLIASYTSIWSKNSSVNCGFGGFLLLRASSLLSSCSLIGVWVLSPSWSPRGRNGILPSSWPPPGFWIP